MQKKTRSLLEELDSLYVERDRRLIIETRADSLTRKLLNAIRTKDAGKFSRSVRRTHAD